MMASRRTGKDDLVPWLRKRMGMAIQCAQALPHAVGNLRSQFSPTQLYALHTGLYALLNHLIEAGDEQGIRLLAESYQMYDGYREEWRPSTTGESEGA